MKCIVVDLISDKVTWQPHRPDFLWIHRPQILSLIFSQISDIALPNTGRALGSGRELSFLSLKVAIALLTNSVLNCSKTSTNRPKWSVIAQKLRQNALKVLEHWHSDIDYCIREGEGGGGSKKLLTRSGK